MIKAGIVIDAWKLPVFEYHLVRNGYKFENAGAMESGVLVLQVQTDNPGALREVIKAAQAECLVIGSVH